MITKAELLKGKKACREIELETYGGETLYIRKLSEGEVGELFDTIVEGGKISQAGEKTDITMDGKKALKNQRMAKNMAVAFSLTNDKNDDEWKPEEVESLPQDTVDELVEKVAEYSGLLSRKTFQSWKRETEAKN